MWQESHMGRETRESKVARLERHVGRRSCGSSDMRTCQKMAQWGPIAEDDDLAGRKCEKGASLSTDKLESLSHDAATTCAFFMMRPVANARLLLSQRISGRNRAPLWRFLTPGRRNSAIGTHGNQRQSSQRTSDAQMPLRRGMYVRRPKTSKLRRRREEVSASQMRHQVTVGNTPLHSHV